MELREQLKGEETASLRFVEPLAIPDFNLFKEPIGPVEAPGNAKIPLPSHQWLSAGYRSAMV
jgi:type I restriction enzyme, S subunit